MRTVTCDLCGRSIGEHKAAFLIRETRVIDGTPVVMAGRRDSHICEECFEKMMELNFEKNKDEAALAEKRRKLAEAKKAALEVARRVPVQDRKKICAERSEGMQIEAIARRHALSEEVIRRILDTAGSEYKSRYYSR